MHNQAHVDLRNWYDREIDGLPPVRFPLDHLSILNVHSCLYHQGSEFAKQNSFTYVTAKRNNCMLPSTFIMNYSWKRNIKTLYFVLCEVINGNFFIWTWITTLGPSNSL